MGFVETLHWLWFVLWIVSMLGWARANANSRGLIVLCKQWEEICADQKRRLDARMGMGLS